MYSWKLVLCLTVLFIPIIASVRLIIADVICYYISRNARKKRKKGQTFFEWLTYKRFLDIIPNNYLFWYWSYFAFYFLCVVLTFILEHIFGSFDIATLPGLCFGAITPIPPFVVHWLWTDFKTRESNPGRTLDKRKTHKWKKGDRSYKHKK